MKVMKLTPSSEDYLEALLMLSRESKVVRVKDLATQMGVTMSSVVSAMHHLRGKGLVVHERYGYLELTDEGERVAQDILQKHNLLFHFFHNILGVERKRSERDACSIEHHLSAQTLGALIVFLNLLEREGYLEEFREKIREAMGGWPLGNEKR